MFPDHHSTTKTMNTLTAVLFLICVSSVHLANLVCGPQACMTVKCGIPLECRHITAQVPEVNDPKIHAHPQDEHRYRIIPKGGYCGCCDLCQKLLRENEHCSLIASTGMASSAVCDDDLKCDHQKLICVKA